MEIVSVCTGRVWRALLWTHDAISTRWVRQLHEPTFGAPAGRNGRAVAWEAQREMAAAADPLVEVHLNATSTGAVAWATLGEARTSLRRAGADAEQGGGVRPATTIETLRIGLHWLLGWQHMGCFHPDERAFFWPRVDAETWVVDEVEDWVKCGAPFPCGVPAALFVAFEGRDVRLATCERVTQALTGIDEVTGGVFLTDRPGTRCMMACATAPRER